MTALPSVHAGGIAATDPTDGTEQNNTVQVPLLFSLPLTTLFGCFRQVADARKDDMLQNTSPEYVAELSEDLLKWYTASNRGILRYVPRFSADTAL